MYVCPNYSCRVNVFVTESRADGRLFHTVGPGQCVALGPLQSVLRFVLHVRGLPSWEAMRRADEQVRSVGSRVI